MSKANLGRNTDNKVDHINLNQDGKAFELKN
jgi:hypothetical protein